MLTFIGFAPSEGLLLEDSWGPGPSDSEAVSLPWTVACRAPLSMGFPRQEYWSGLLFPSPGDLPDPGIELALLRCRWILYH